ncbi:MAG TPA: DUF4394 domain-containing protein [Gemmatimonadales bacterium]|nr:DUF4394 domain-containing protein [Gemmatimonadales bacterium]
MRPLLACRVSRVIQLGLLILSVGCGGDSNNPNPTNQGKTIYAVDLSNNFELFHSAAPGTVDRKVAITGLPAENRIVGIDFRPADGKLYGVGNDSRVYVLDTLTAVASPIGSTAFTPALAGEHFGMALDPTTDQIRIQSAETGQNLRLDPVTGQAVADDAVLAYVTGDPNETEGPSIAATAVSTSSGASTTYGIDWLLDALVMMPDPTDGQVTTIGATGVSTSPCAALDMGDDGVLYATMTIDQLNQLFTMNLSTGAATGLGEINVVASIQSIAVAPGGSATDREMSVVRSPAAIHHARGPVGGGSPKSCRTDR